MNRILYKLKQIRAFRSFGTDSFPTEREREKRKNAAFEKRPKFSVLVPLFNTPEDFLYEMIMSVLGQTYENLELCLGDGSDPSHAYVERVCTVLGEKDSRIIYKKFETNDGISDNTNKCLDLAGGDYICLLDHDDILHPDALFEYARAINENDADFLYCDEVIFKRGNIDWIHMAFLKPDFAPDNLRSCNYITHFVCFKRSLAEGEEKLLRPEFDGSQDHDLILRLTSGAGHIVHIPKVLYYWRAHSGSVAGDLSVKDYAVDAGIRAVAAHLREKGFEGAEITSTPEVRTHYRIRYPLMGRPLVSVIVKACENEGAPEQCISSVKAGTSYDNFEVVVLENSSREALEEALSGAKGEYLVFLDGSCEIISSDWLEEMLMFAQRDDVGAVGAKVRYPDGSIAHAGIVLGMGPEGLAGYVFQGTPKGAIGFLGTLTYARNVSAVSSACMMVSRKKFEAVGGFDAEFMGVEEDILRDVSFCLKLRQQRYLNVFTPFAEVCVVSQWGRLFSTHGELTHVFREKWGGVIAAGDPYYNPNLSLKYTDCRFKERF
ncbi:MAG: glycosyltransferase [Lachnospiraceae bacterium]|nr:glycosyltransferase [Lachnospiraceae bacterium]